MASYYYLISSLPMLRSDGTIPMTYSEFLSTCKSCVSEGTYEALCNIFDSSRHPLLKKWEEFYKSLMIELSYQRNLKLGKPALVPSDRDTETVNSIAACLTAKNPLVAEQMLLALEFKKLDDMMGIHGFDEYFLYGYAIKLKLLERQTVFTEEEGKKEFASLFNGVKKQILSM